MTIEREALKLALEALSKSDDFLFEWHDNESDNEADAYATARQLNVQAITAIKEALAQPEIEYQERILRLEGALKKALAQPEWKQHKQEPVAHVLFRQDDDGLEPIMFYPPTTAPDPQTLKDRFILKDVWLSPPQRKPLTDEQKDAERYRWLFNDVDLTAIKTAFDEQKAPPANMHSQIIEQIIGFYMDKQSVDAMVDAAIEAAHGIKGDA